MLFNEFRFKGALAVTRYVEFKLTVFGFNAFAALAVATV
tara:strand:- start:227 stop:343 length:117 start_codon:yes stop_codon:yes gene_type:complete